MNLLLTGASGFLGTHVLRCLRHEKQWKKIIVLHRGGTEQDLIALQHQDSRIELLHVSFQDSGLLLQQLVHTKADAVLHMAAVVQHTRSPSAELWQVNVDCTRALATFAGEHRAKFFFVSTSGVVGCSRMAHLSSIDLPGENAPYVENIIRSWPYYHSKMIAEQAVFATTSLYQSPITVFRPPVLLGPDDYKHRSTGHLRKMISGQLPFLIQGSIHFVDVRDVAQAIVRALDQSSIRSVYHFPGTEMKIVTFFQEAARLANCTAPRILIPATFARPLCRLAQSIADWRKIKSMLPDPVVIEMAQHHWSFTSHYAFKDLNFSPRLGIDTLGDTIESILQENRLIRH